MSEKEKSSGMIKTVIAGVLVSIITAVILSFLGLDKNSSSDNTKILENQKVLAEKLAKLGDQNTNQKQEALKNQIEEYEDIINEPNSQNQQTNVININGSWQDPYTGLFYMINQNNNMFTIQEFSQGIVSAVGKGNITGTTAIFSYNTVLGTYGDGTVTISTVEDYLSIQCTDYITQMTSQLNLYR